MPHQLPNGKNVVSGQNMLQQRPELAAMIGYISNEWNYLEQQFENLYALLMGRMYIQNLLSLGPNSSTAHPVAFQIFEELESFRAKRNLFMALAKWAFSNCPAKFEEYQTVLKRPIDGAYKARNDTVHMLWGICDDYPDALISRPTFGVALVWRKNDFGESLKVVRKGLTGFNQASAQLFEFVQNVRVR